MANRKGGFIGQDGLNAPDEPTGVSASAGDTEATISFTAPSDVGGAAITGYVATSNDGIGATGSSSPITVTGLTNDSSYTFRVWALNAFGYSAPSDVSGSVTPQALNVGLFAGHFTGGAASNVIERINILSSGNSTDFGDLSVARYSGAGMSSSTRAVFGGGNDRSSGNDSNYIDYVAFATGGNATDFGDCTAQFQGLGGSSNGVYGGMFKGYENAGANNTIQRITIATTGNATNQGDTSQRAGEVTACGNTTYALMASGRDTSSNPVNVIERATWVTISSASDFGDLTVSRYSAGGASSSTRAVFAGGNSSGANTNTIDYVTIATLGNATDFGDLTYVRNATGAVSNKITAVFSANQYDKTMDSVTIASTGNAIDFGEMVNFQVGGVPLATSDSHGGIA